jgi:hypothetical protein
MDWQQVSSFQESWASIGEEVCNVISNFFSHGKMDEEINATYIVLVPKTPNPTTVNEFHPISLCNVLYKITSKVLANILKLILLYIISYNQSAFILGRLIPDNVLAAYEALHSMQTRMWGKMGYVALNLDISKAYDRVE